MTDYKHTKPYKRPKPHHGGAFVIAFLVMLATVYAIVYFGDMIDSF